MLVAHFSDLHLLSLEGVRPLDFLGKRLTGGVNLLFNRAGQFPLRTAELLVDDLNRLPVEHLILSGDLSNLSFPAEFRLARSLLERVRLPPKQVTVVPGNHDVYTREAAAADHFGRILEPFLEGDRQLGPGRFPMLRLQGELCIVALSSAVPSAPLMATGQLGKVQRRLLEELLDSKECRSRFRLVVLHHPPEHPAIRRHNRLVDGPDLTALLRRTGADLVVHGHLHRFARQLLAGPEGPIPLIGVASGTFVSRHDPERRAQYNLYELEGKKLIRIRRRRFDPARGEFEEI